MKTDLAYKKAGVDIDSANASKAEMAESLRSPDRRVLNGIGPFASLFDAVFPGIEDPVLVLKMEEPGSKQLLAIKYKRPRGIAYDVVNHLINDVIVMGATPLAVLDAIICGRLERNLVVELVRSMAAACREQSCSLVGGETSEQPGVIPAGRYILAASAVGVVSKANVIDGSRIEPGDKVLSIASNGLHTNGYALVRNLIKRRPGIVKRKVDGRRFLDVILEPHLCYYRALRGLFGFRGLHGLAHITGGGVAENLRRILPSGVNAHIDLTRITPLPIFRLIRSAGGVPDHDMLRTFNMGVGMVAVAAPSAVGIISRHVETRGYRITPIGEITSGSCRVIFAGELAWSQHRMVR